MVKIFIDPGHGGHDPGAVANGLQEKNLVLDIARRIRSKLLQYENVQVRMSRDSDVFLELSTRAKLANDWGADYFLSIHINAGGGEGFESFIYNGSVSSATVGNQNVIHQEIVRATGWRDRGKKRANLSVLRNTRMSGILTENGFIDTVADANKLKQSSFLDKIAQGHVNGLVKIFGLKPKSTGGNKMLDKAIVINSFVDYVYAEALANKLACPIYTRNVAWGRKVASTVYVIGGDTSNLQADRFVVLSGSDRFSTAAKVSDYLKSL